MYASPASLLRLPTPRRRVTQGKICACGVGTPASDAPAERGRPLVWSCGAGMPASDATAGQGHPEATILRILGALKERAIHWGLRLRVFYAVSRGHPPPRRRDMYRPSIHTVCKILHMKTTLKLKMNMLRVHLELESLVVETLWFQLQT
jgi:hypothetical protein